MSFLIEIGYTMITPIISGMVNHAFVAVDQVPGRHTSVCRIIFNAHLGAVVKIPEKAS